MRNAHRTRGRVIHTVAVWTLAFMMAAGATAFAQRWQNSHGGAGTDGDEGNAVIECSNGDYVAAGVTRSINGTNPYIYVVRTDANGVPIWDGYYKVGPSGPCGATDIKEDPNGELVVVGWLENAGACAACRDAFVMRIKGTGGIIWIRRFKGILSSAEARSVVIAQQGNFINTFPGDIIVAGATSTGVLGGTDGFLARLSAAGGFVWVRMFNVTGASGFANDDEFNGVDETQIVSASGLVGDIVAVGKSADAQAGFLNDVWVVRVDGNSGTFNGAPQGSALYGSGVEDVGTSIQELRFGANPGALAVTGYSDGRPAPSTAREIIVLELFPDVCDPTGPFAAIYYGDNGALDDVGLSVREITNPAVGTVGDLVTTGGTRNSAFGGEDAFLQEFQEGTLAPVSAFTVYGDVNDEEGRSVTQAQLAPNTQGFVFTGFTQSPVLMPAGNSRNLYLVKADNALNSFCSFTTVTASDVASGWVPNCVTPGVKKYGVLLKEQGGTSSPGWVFQICFSPFRIEPQGGGNDGISGVDLNMDAAGALSSYPNPVISGNGFNVRFTSHDQALTTLTVADITGRIVYSNSMERGTGATSELINTTGWALGSYLVTLTSGTHRATTRVVVIGK